MQRFPRQEIRRCQLCTAEFPFNAIPSKVAAGHGQFCSRLCQQRGKRRQSLEERFFKHLGRKAAGGCILWGGGLHNTGYGCMGGKFLAHRVAYQLFIGPIPEGLHVLHRCDNRLCINPMHLFVGTSADNTADMVAKGRQARGESSGVSKLTTDMVGEIRRRCAAGESQARVASDLEIDQSTVSYVVNRKRWKHI